MNEPLTEHCNLLGVPVRVNREAGVIQGVKILGLESKNGRVYRAAALQRSVPLYEGARVNVNHPAHGGQLPRGYEDRIGAVRNVRARGDGLYGDFHFNPKHRLAEQLVWDAEHSPENVGFSHNVLARTSREGDKTVVEEITRVQSVDLVADPATTRGLFEGAAASSAVSAWDNAAQAWVPVQRSEPQSASAPAATLEATQQRLVLEAENRRLRQELDTVRAEMDAVKRRLAVDAALASSSLPAELLTSAFREQCYTAADERTLARLIEARREDARLLLHGRPRSIEQNGDSGRTSAADAASFAASIR